MHIALAYFAMLAIWSTVPLSVKWSMVGSNFLSAVSARILIAAVFMAIVLAAARIRLPLHRKALQTYAVSSVNYFGMMMLYWGAQFVPSGWLGVMFGCIPLYNAVMCALWLGEREFQPLKIAGLATGIIGLLVIFAKAIDLSLQIGVAMLAISLAVAIAAGVGIWVKRIGAHLPGMVVAGGGLLTAMPFYLLLWLSSGAPAPSELSTRTIAATLYIAIIGTGVVFTLYYFVMKHMSLARLALIGMVSPVCALLLGNVLNDEPVNVRVWFGTALIVAALVLHEYLPYRLAGIDAPATPEEAELEETSLMTRYD